MFLMSPHDFRYRFEKIPPPDDKISILKIDGCRDCRVPGAGCRVQGARFKVQGTSSSLPELQRTWASDFQ